LGEREREGAWEQFLRDQTDKTFSGLEVADISKCIIAYEPVWAISTTPGAKPDTAESALESIQLIREMLNSKLTFLYGGSVTPANAADFLNEPEINGVLVGGASVRKEDFIKILSLIL
jgi:triosephosphate isomerase